MKTFPHPNFHLMAWLIWTLITSSEVGLWIWVPYLDNLVHKHTGDDLWRRKKRESWTSLSDKLMLPKAFEVSQMYFAPKCWSNTLVFNCWSLMIHYTPQFQIKLFSFSFLLPNSVHQRCFINEPERCRCTLNAKMLFDSFSWRLRLHRLHDELYPLNTQEPQ